MTRKDYILIAGALRKAGDIHVYQGDEYQKGKRIGVEVASEYIADALQVDNPEFDRRKFIKYVKGE